MELELGLKITRTREDVSSSVDFHFSKDPFGPLVLSRETDSRFIIIIHLKGFKKEGIEIEINEEGNRITVKGRKPVEEMVMVRWMAWRKEVEFRVFKLVFRIPDTVDLDEIKARFDDDGATLTITMPKRVKGISGFNIEAEEEEGERVEKGEVEEESKEREESDVHSEKFETEIQREEEFGENMENQERENQVLEGEEKGFSEGLEEEEFEEKESRVLGDEQKDEEETEDDYLEKSHQIDGQDEILERIEEEKELADLNKESEDSSLRKPLDIEGRDSHEKTRHDEQDKKQQLVEAESKSDDFGFRAFGEIEGQEPDEQLDRTSESGAKEKKTTDDAGDGLRKVQGTAERERHNDERKIQGIMVQGKGGEDKKKIVKTEIKNADPKEDVEARMGEGFIPNIDTTQVTGEDDITETEQKADGYESDEVDKIHELPEKNEEKGKKAKVIRQSEDKSLIKLQEDKKQHSKGEKTHREHEKIKELVEDKTPKAETDIRTNIPKPVKEIEVPEVDTLGKTGDEGKEGKEKQNLVKKKIKDGDAKEKNDVKIGEVFTSSIADTATKSEDFVSDKLEPDEEVDKTKKLVEKKDKQEENTKVGAQSEDISLRKLQEIGEQQFQGQKRHDRQEEIKELVEEEIPEAETNIGNDRPKPVQERCEGKHKIQKNFQEETKDQQEEYKEKIKETGKMTNDAGERKFQEIIRQQELDEPARSGRESKTRELVKDKRNDEEKEKIKIAETDTKVQESNRPKMLREQEKIQEVAEENTNFSKKGKVKEEEEIAEKKTEFGDDDDDDDDDISRTVRDSDAMKGQEEKDMIQELVLEEKVSDGGKGITAVSEKKAEDDKSKKVQEIDEQQSHKEDTCGKQFQELIVSSRGKVEDMKKTEEEKGIRDGMRKGQETERTESDVSGTYIKGTTIQELDNNREIYRNEHEEEKKYDRPEKITGSKEQELVNLNNQLEQDNVEDGEKTQEQVEEEIKDCKEEEGSEESKIKNDDDVLRKIEGIKEEFYEPKMELVSKIKELLEEKRGDHEKEEEKELAESEIKPECSSLRKADGSEEQKLHEPKIRKERDKTRINEVKKQSGQEKEEEEEKAVESMTIAENENSKNVQEIMEERHEKPDRHEKRFKIQEVVETGHDNYKEEREEKEMAKTELETEEESSKKVQKIEQQEYDGLKRSMVQDKMQETGEKEKTKAIEEKEILEKRTKTKDCSLRKVRDDEDPELSKPYKGQKEGKIHEPVEMVTSDYREKDKNQDEDGEQSNIPQLEEGEKVENIESSGKFNESEEGKSYEDWTHEEREKRKDLVKEESADPKDKHTGGDDHKEEQQDEQVTAKAELKIEEDSSKKVREIEEQEYNKSKRSMEQEKMRETGERDKTRAMEENEIVESRKVQEGEDPELSRHKRHGEEDRNQKLAETEISDHREKVKKKDILTSQDTGKLDLSELERHWEERKNLQLVEDEKGEGKIENISKPGGIMEGDSSEKFHEFQKQKSYEDYREEEESVETGKSVKVEATDLKVKRVGREVEHEDEERYEKVAETKTKVEDETNKKVGEYKEVDLEKHERLGKVDNLGGVLREGASDHEKEEENLLDEFMTETQQNENEELHELEMHEKLDILQGFMEDKEGDQEDEEAEEAAAVVASNEIGSSKNVQTIEEEEQKEQKKIAETQEEVPNTRSVGETKELEEHIQELEGKSGNCRDHDGEERTGEKGRQGKSVETMSWERFKTEIEDGIVSKIQETKVQESNEKKNQEWKGKIEEPYRKETSSHEVNESLKKDQEFLEKESNMSKRRPVKQEKIQQLKKAETQDRVNEDEEQGETETKINDGKSSMNEEQKKIRKPMEEKSNAPEKEKEANEKIAEERMKDKVDSRVKDREIKEQEPYELLKHGEVDKIQEYYREEEKGIKQRKIEEMKRTAKDVNLQKVQQINDELEKHRKPSEMPEKHNIQESLVEEPQKHREEEMNERGGYKAVLQTKSMASRESQDVEEKGSNQPKSHYEQELMVEEDGKEEYHIREGEQKEMAKSLSQVESIANDDSLEKNETEGHKSRELREQKKKENHQELVGIETSDQRKEEIEEEKVVGKAETIDEYDGSRKIQGLEEERKSDKMSEIIFEEETSDDDKEAKEGNRAGEVWREGEKKVRDDSFEKIRQIKEQEQDKKQSYVKKDTSGKAKENKNQETKSRDESSGNKSQEDEKQESHEQTRNEVEVIGKAETIDKYDSSRKIYGHEEERKSDKMSEKLAEEERSNDKEANEVNRAKAVLGEVETTIGKVRELEKQAQDKKQSFVEKDTSGKSEEKKNQETKSRGESSGKTQENEKPESHEKRKNEEQDKKNHGNEHKEIAEAEVPRKLKGIEKQESTKMAERHENRDNIKELVEENNQEGEEKKSMISDVLKKVEDDESKGPEGLRKEDKNSEQSLRCNLKDEKTAKTETKSKDIESRKIHEIKEEVSNEQERLKEQGTIKELVEDRTHYCREEENRETEFEEGSSKKIQERDKEKPTEPGRDEKRDKIQEPVDSEDNEEELEIEFEDEEEDWEAEVIQDPDSDEDNIRKMKRIRLGFRLVGGSTLFMSLIVIVISFIRSKRKLRCYKF